jgi:hypothetical protein
VSGLTRIAEATNVSQLLGFQISRVKALEVKGNGCLKVYESFDGYSSNKADKVSTHVD